MTNDDSFILSGFMNNTIINIKLRIKTINTQHK